MKLMEKALQGISMPTFYKFGSILMSCSALGSAINAKMQWAGLNLGGKISMVSGFFFQTLFVTLFVTLYFQTREPKIDKKVINNPGLDKFLEELKLEDKVKGGNKNDKKNIINN